MSRALYGIRSDCLVIERYAAVMEQPGNLHRFKCGFFVTRNAAIVPWAIALYLIIARQDHLPRLGYRARDGSTVRINLRYRVSGGAPLSVTMRTMWIV